MLTKVVFIRIVISHKLLITNSMSMKCEAFKTMFRWHKYVFSFHGNYFVLCWYWWYHSRTTTKEFGETWQGCRVFSDNMMTIVCLDLTKCYNLC